MQNWGERGSVRVIVHEELSVVGMPYCRKRQRVQAAESAWTTYHQIEIFDKLKRLTAKYIASCSRSEHTAGQIR